MQLVIVRGTEEAGRAKLVSLFTEYMHLESKQFLFDAEEGAVPSAVQMAEAERGCQHEVLRALRRGVKVVVYGQFDRVEEFQSYLDMANILRTGYSVISVEGRGQEPFSN